MEREELVNTFGNTVLDFLELVCDEDPEIDLKELVDTAVEICDTFDEDGITALSVLIRMYPLPFLKLNAIT